MKEVKIGRPRTFTAEMVSEFKDRILQLQKDFTTVTKTMILGEALQIAGEQRQGYESHKNKKNTNL